MVITKPTTIRGSTGVPVLPSSCIQITRMTRLLSSVTRSNWTYRRNPGSSTRYCQDLNELYFCFQLFLMFFCCFLRFHFDIKLGEQLSEMRSSQLQLIRILSFLRRNKLSNIICGAIMPIEGIIIHIKVSEFASL